MCQRRHVARNQTFAENEHSVCWGHWRFFRTVEPQRKTWMKLHSSCWVRQQSVTVAFSTRENQKLHHFHFWGIFFSNILWLLSWSFLQMFSLTSNNHITAQKTWHCCSIMHSNTRSFVKHVWIQKWQMAQSSSPCNSCSCRLKSMWLQSTACCV